MPRGVRIHLSCTARLTVVTWTPTVSAICCIVSGTRNSETIVEKPLLMIDDRLRDLCQRAAPLLNRINQPLGRVDLALDPVLFRRRRLARQHSLPVVLADIQSRRAGVLEVRSR